MARVLFILKHREQPWGCYGHHLSSGLHNSASYVHGMLLSAGISSKLVHVEDNNSIDREVTVFRPTHVIIEAYWVVPEKFDILKKLHPGVKWIVRNHSEIPFLSQEGMTVDWTIRYIEKSVLVSSNSPRATDSIRQIIKAAHPEMKRKSIEALTPMLTNYYPASSFSDVWAGSWDRKTVEIGCFGSVRPLKNHLIQAVAAIRYAESVGKPLNFHINSSRVEGRAEPVLCNLRQLFAHMPKHKLVEHGWTNVGDFLALCWNMDLVMQVSFSETFNFVAADAISQGTPVVVSSEIPWATSGFADTTDEPEISSVISVVLDNPKRNVIRNWESLTKFSKSSKVLWLAFL